MTFIITDPCIGTKDTACVEACPVDCIHPRKEEKEFGEATMLFIDPDECIDCGACVPVCPVTAIYPEDEVPASQERLIEANKIYRVNDPEARTQAEALVKQHIDSHSELMAIPASDRASKH